LCLLFFFTSSSFIIICSIHKANQSEQLTDASDTDTPVRARGSSYAELVRRQAELDLADPRVLSSLGQDDADEYLATYTGTGASADDEGSSLIEKDKGSSSPQRSKLLTMPSDHYVVADGDDDDDDVEVVDAEEDDEDDAKGLNPSQPVLAAEDSDDEDDVEVVEEEVEEAELVEPTTTVSSSAAVDDDDDNDDCEVVEAADEETAAELSTHLSAVSMKDEKTSPTDEMKAEEVPNAVTTWRLQCSGQKVPVRAAPNPHAEVLRYLYSGTRIRTSSQTVSGFFQLANGGVSLIVYIIISLLL